MMLTGCLSVQKQWYALVNLHSSMSMCSRQGCSLGLDVSVSRRSFQTSRSRLGLVETWVGLGLDLVSDWKPNVSVSSRSRAIGSRLQVNIHSFLLHCKIARTSFWMFTDSQAKVSFTSPQHTFAIAIQYTIQKVLFLDFANAKSLITSSKTRTHQEMR